MFGVMVLLGMGLFVWWSIAQGREHNAAKWKGRYVFWLEPIVMKVVLDVRAMKRDIRSEREIRKYRRQINEASG